MFNNVAVQDAIIARLNQLIADDILPAGMLIAPYAGQIDIIRLNVEMGGASSAIFVNWQGDSGMNELTPTLKNEIKFSLLICTQAEDMTEALGYLDILSGYDVDEHWYFLNTWINNNGIRLWDVFREPARPVFNLKLKQVISFPIVVAE